LRWVSNGQQGSINPGSSVEGEREARPVAVLLAGPNGAGKSTSSSRLVPPECVFLNADLVAARLVGEDGPVAGVETVLLPGWK
jgi:hypothetical protein